MGRGHLERVEANDKGPNDRGPEAHEAMGRAVGIKINCYEARTSVISAISRITVYLKELLKVSCAFSSRASAQGHLLFPNLLVLHQQRDSNSIIKFRRGFI